MKHEAKLSVYLHQHICWTCANILLSGGAIVSVHTQRWVCSLLKTAAATPVVGIKIHRKQHELKLKTEKWLFVLLCCPVSHLGDHFNKKKLPCSSKIFDHNWGFLYCINFIVSTLRVRPHEACCAFCPQHVSLHTFFQVCRQGFGSSVPYCEGESQAVEALDLPAPTCFRSRSHSYLRAIQAGCSQDEDTASVDSDSLPPISAGYSSNTSKYQ